MFQYLLLVWAFAEGVNFGLSQIDKVEYQSIPSNVRTLFSFLSYDDLLQESICNNSHLMMSSINLLQSG